MVAIKSRPQYVKANLQYIIYHVSYIHIFLLETSALTKYFHMIETLLQTYESWHDRPFSCPSGLNSNPMQSYKNFIWYIIINSVLDTDMISIIPHSIANSFFISFLYDHLSKLCHLCEFPWLMTLKKITVLHWIFVGGDPPVPGRFASERARDGDLLVFCLLLARASCWTNGRIETISVEKGSDFLTYDNFPKLSA